MRRVKLNLSFVFLSAKVWVSDPMRCDCLHNYFVLPQHWGKHVHIFHDLYSVFAYPRGSSKCHQKYSMPDLFNKKT